MTGLLGIFSLFTLLVSSWCFSSEGCSSGVATGGYKKAVIVVDPISSGALIPKALLKRNILPIYVRSDLSLVDRQAATLDLSQFPYRESLDLSLLSQIESGVFVAALNGLKQWHQTNPNGIYASVSGGESGVLFAEKFGAALNLPLHNPPEGILSRRYKWHQHQAAKKAGVSVMPQILSNSVDETEKWIEKYLGGWSTVKRVVVKSGISHAGDQVVVCNNSIELRDAMTRLLNHPTSFGRFNRRVIVQPFIPGKEYAVNGACYRYNGKLFCRLTDVWEYIKPEPPKYGHEVLLQPTEIPAGLVEQQFKMAQALKLNFGVFHGEWRITPSGKIYLIESALRPYGAGNAAIAGDSTTYGQIDALADILDDPNLFLERVASAYTTTHHAFVININVPSAQDGKLARLGSLQALVAKIQAENHLYKAIYFVREGSPLVQTSDLITTLAQIEIRIPITTANARAIAESYIDALNRLQTSGDLWH